MSDHYFNFVSPPPCLSTLPTRRLRTRRSYVYASSSINDEFFLPANRRTDIRQTPNPSSRPTISARRSEQKRKEVRKSIPDEDEEFRSEIADVQLSANDLFGDISNFSSSDLLDGTGIIQSESEALSSNAIETASGNVSETTTKPSTPKSKKATVTKRKNKSSNTVETIAKKENGTAIESIAISKSKTNETRTSSKSFLNIGDLVTHTRHGIGRFIGLERRRDTDADSTVLLREFAVIEYRDGDVFVPLSHFDLISKLSREQGKKVQRLDVIANSGAHQTYSASSRNRRAKFLARQRTREKIRQQIINLHGMYAQRSTFRREPFAIDKVAEETFCKLCNFELTSDQRSATTEILSDLSDKELPMDRLLCGDVGFGKTEVAMRAAFRAVKAGKQVAVLAPTTILAQQHFDTFSGRLHKYDPSITIGCFNRFIPRKELDKNRDLLADNKIQVAIGTHMLLGSRITFPSLGLLIVDEEHRFGVNQKEKIRANHRYVDTLFLSATPIPRTLHLSLAGLRDASILRIPPIGRKPVVTHVERHGSGIVRNAILKEIQRGGQTFYVVPRIEGIEETASWIQNLFFGEEIRILVAHGASADLEKRIWAFAQKEYDVLLCTSVIENGIDMPSVNTIIIQDASRFGLAQLHQLRGRVGRGNQQAYAWLLYNETAARSLVTLQKLKALEENSQLGAGFAIAQRDMEMRGIGTILGVEQHGNNAVGAEEYATMLAEELECIRTGKPTPLKVPKTDTVDVLLPVASYIPDEYVTDFDEKMRAYKRLSDCGTFNELDSLAEEMIHTFGDLPPETQKHITLLKLKLYAKDLGIQKIWTERQHVIMDWRVDGSTLKRLIAFLPEKTARDRCEHIDIEERVVIRGLGVTGGDTQLAKMTSILENFSKAAENLPREGEEEKSLADTLGGLGSDRK